MAAAFCRRSFINYKNCVFQTQKRTGFIVLIPQTPEEAADCRVCSTENLPDFTNFNSNTCHLLTNKFATQYEVGMYELNEFLEKNKTEKIDIFKQLFEPLEVLSVPFEMSFGIASTLFFSNSKMGISTSNYQRLSEKVKNIKTYKFNLNSVFSLCKKNLEEENNFTDEQKRILKKFVWEGTLSGISFSVPKKESLWNTFQALEINRNEYDIRFKAAKNAFEEVVKYQKFAEESPIDLLRYTAPKWEKPFEGPWKITLNSFIYERFLEFCNVREARFHVWLAKNQLCSKYGEPCCNSIMFAEHIKVERFRYAQHLGFSSYAHLAINNKMAGSVDNVQNVLSELLEPAKKAQEKELYELEKFAYLQGSRVTLELCDYSYWKRLYLKHTRDIDELTLRDYFPLSQVLLGLVALCEQLFGIEIEEDTFYTSGWNADVRYFRILDEKTKAFIGGFFFDPYAHKNKVIGEYNKGWFIPMRPKSKYCNSFPLSSLIFSFEPPDGDKPSLLYFRDVENLFDKFGMMLQFTLTEMNFSEVSGLSNVDWDASRVCNEFLRCWLSDKHTLESISGHYSSGEPLPNKILDNLSQINKYMAGIRLSELIYFSMLDIKIHTEEKKSFITIMEELWPQHFLFKLFPSDNHCYGFNHVISGFWGGSYYSLLWSEMLAADIFSAFEEAGFNNKEEISLLGKRFRSTFLALGGGCDAKEVFRRFRGREPNPKLLLKVLGIKDPPPASSLSSAAAPHSEGLIAEAK